jgi:CHAT domain-containing protein
MKWTPFLFLLFFSPALAQINLGDFVKNKALDAKDFAHDKVIEKLEKQRQQFDESNFNYAICFTENSGAFETEEKGSALSNLALNADQALQKEAKSTEQRAYTNLRNGELLMAGNNYHLAEKSFLLAKLLYEADDKQQTLNYAQTLSNLALLYQTTGRFTKAFHFNEKAIALRKELNNEPLLGVSENNLGVLYKECGQYDEAERLLLQAQSRNTNNKLALSLIKNNLALLQLDLNNLKQAEKLMKESLILAGNVLKKDASNYIKLQINYATVLKHLKRYSEAEAIYREAIAAKEKKLGVHPDLATLKKGLAQIYLAMGKSNAAGELFEEAVDIHKKKLGESHPATLSALGELGNFYRVIGQNTKALEVHQLVCDKRKNMYGKTHPLYIQSLEDLALSQWKNGKTVDGLLNYQVVMQQTLPFIRTTFKSLNEAEKSDYWSRTAARINRYNGLVLAEALKTPSLVAQAYQNLLETRGFLMDGSTRLRHRLLTSNDTAISQLYKEWLSTMEQINHGYELSKDEIKQQKINTDSLTERAGALERQLSVKSADFKNQKEQIPVGAEQIKASLQKDEACVDVVLVHPSESLKKSIYYAFVLTPASLKLVLLGEGSAIDAAILTFRQKATTQQPEQEAWKTIWKNLDALLEGYTRLFVCPDGLYHLVSLPALKDPSGKYLADKHIVVLTGNSREVPAIKQREKQPQKPQNAYVFANPKFGNASLIDQLPGTEAEAAAISKLFLANAVPVVQFKGERATEKVVKGLKSPSILHIATHGYFLDDVSQVESEKLVGVEVGIASENPLLRSGLLFAGCENVFDPDYHPAIKEENGVLTAFEALRLNLDETQLVVLSACETGLGKVREGEGVYGLQRTMMVAGAKNLLVSLWPVSDDATNVLMTAFYGAYLKSENVAQAYAEAMKSIRKIYPQPYYWGAFVLISR